MTLREKRKELKELLEHLYYRLDNDDESTLLSNRIDMIEEQIKKINEIIKKEKLCIK